VLAYKGYDGDARVLDQLEAAEMKSVIPPISNRKEPRDDDKDLYKARHLIDLRRENSAPRCFLILLTRCRRSGSGPS